MSIHDALALLASLDSVHYPPCSSVRLTGDDCCLVPVDNVIFCVDVVCDRLIADLLCSDCDCLFVLLVYLRIYYKNATHQLTNVTETHEKVYGNA